MLINTVKRLLENCTMNEAAESILMARNIYQINKQISEVQNYISGVRNIIPGCSEYNQSKKYAYHMKMADHKNYFKN